MLGQMKQRFFWWVLLFFLIFSYNDCYALVGKTGKNYDFRVVGLNVGNFSIGKTGEAKGTESLSKDLKEFFVNEDADIYMLSEWDKYFNISKGIKSVDEFSSYLKAHNYYIKSNCGFGLENIVNKNYYVYVSQINIIKRRSGFEVNDHCSIRNHTVDRLRGFVVNQVKVNGRIVHFITVHFSVNKRDNRMTQIQEVIDYIKNNEITYFVITGDMNLGLGGEEGFSKALYTADEVDMFNNAGYISAQGNKIIKEVFDFKNEVCTDNRCEKEGNCEVENAHCRFYKYPQTGKMYYFLRTGGQHGYYDNIVVSNNLKFTYVYYAGKRSKETIEERTAGVLSDHLAIVADIAFNDGAGSSRPTNAVNSSLSKTDYRISFDGNGSTSGTTNSVVCKKNGKCRLPKNAYIRTGYKFLGWSKKANSNGRVDYKDNSEVTMENSVHLYAVWEKNKIYIKYHVAALRGKIKSSTTSTNKVTYNWSTNSDGLIFRNNKKYSVKSYGTTLEKGLVNWNNKSGVYITNGKKVAGAKEEWCTKPNGGGVCYDQAEKLKKIGTNTGKNRLCDARKGDCSIDLYVNWVDPGVIVRYFPNNGEVTDKNRWIVTDKGIRHTSGLNKELTHFDFGLSTLKNGLINCNNSKYLNIVRDGYVVVNGKEWCTDTDGKGDCFNQSGFNTSIYNLCDKGEKSCIINLYVNWIPRAFTVSYVSNGGNGKMSSHSCKLDRDCSLRKNVFKRSGYSFTGWKKDNSGKLLSAGDNIKNAGNAGDEVKYYAQWTADKK